MEKRPKQSEIVWCESDNETATRTSYHGYYGRRRLTGTGKWTGEKLPGNSALCNKRHGIADENENFLSIDQVEDSGLDRVKVCKRCLILYDKLEA